MISNICSIFDGKAEAYMQPFFVQAIGVAKREFGNLVNDPSHPIGKHPEDYTLFVVGTWEEMEGKLVSLEPRAIGNGLDFKT